MERNRYRFKPHVGPHRQGGKIFHPGDEISLYPYQIEGFADKLELVSGAAPLSESPGERPEMEIETGMQIKSHPTVVGKWDVWVDGNDTIPLNSSPLTLEQARALAGPDASVVEKKTSPRKRGKGVDGKLTALHKGAGRYVILDETSGMVIKGGIDGNYLNKTEAEEFIRAAQSPPPA